MATQNDLHLRGHGVPQDEVSHCRAPTQKSGLVNAIPKGTMSGLLNGAMPLRYAGIDHPTLDFGNIMIDLED